MGTTVTVLLVVTVFCAVASVAFHMAYAPRRIHTFTYAPNFDKPFSVDLSTDKSTILSPDIDEDFEEEAESEIASHYTPGDAIFANRAAHEESAVAGPATAASVSRPVPPSQEETLLGIDEQSTPPHAFARVKAIFSTLARSFVRRAPANADPADATPSAPMDVEETPRTPVFDQPIGISAILGSALNAASNDGYASDTGLQSETQHATEQPVIPEQVPAAPIADEHDAIAAPPAEELKTDMMPAVQAPMQEAEQSTADAESHDPVIQIADYYKRRRKHTEPASPPTALHQEQIEHVAERFKEEHHTEQPGYAWVQEALKSSNVGHVDVTTRLRLLKMYGTLHTASAKALLERAIAEDAEVADEARALLESHG